MKSNGFGSFARCMMRRLALFFGLSIVALTWSASGNAETACSVVRGIDPLDVVRVGTIKHNVFIGLDNSGTMSNRFDNSEIKSLPPGIKYVEDHPEARLRIAKDTLRSIINDPSLNDASGKPLVNWGFFFTALQDDDVGIDDKDSSICANPQTDSNGDFAHDAGCVGLDEEKVLPSRCKDATDSKGPVLDKLRLRADGGIQNNAGTANGVSLDQIAALIKREYTGPTKQAAGQRNIIVYITDGFEDCECRVQTIGFEGAKQLDPPALRVNTNDPNKTLTTVGNNQDRMRFYNAGIKAQHSLQLIDPALDGSKGDIFVLLIAQNDQAIVDGNVHWGWEASGASLDRPVCSNTGGLGCARPGGFASTPERMRNALIEILEQVGVPPSTTSLGPNVLGTVRELIPVADPRVSVQDTVATPINHVRVRNLRNRFPSNVLFSGSVVNPGFQGHLRARNVYRDVLNPDKGVFERVVDNDTPPKTDLGCPATEKACLWDAGVLLRNRDPDTRTILFNLSTDDPGAPLREFQVGKVTANMLGVTAGYLREIDGVGARSAEDAAEIVVRVIRGERLTKDPETGTIYRKDDKLNFFKTENNLSPIGTWKLWDSTTGPTIVTNPPRSIDIDPPQRHQEEYGVGRTTGFYWENVNRQTVVHLPTNGGMLHAFRARDGVELYGLIPDDVLGPVGGELPPAGPDQAGAKLKDLVPILLSGNTGALTHRFFLSGPATAVDAFFDSDGAWHTLLTLGRGRGGNFVSVIDVSDIGDPRGTSLTPEISQAEWPKVVFNKGNRRGVNDGDYDDMGETWSAPQIGIVQAEDLLGELADRAVVFLGAGYGCTGSNEGKFFYAIDAEDGSVIRKFELPPNVSGAAIPQNALVATPTLFNPHQPGIIGDTDFVQRGYVGDLQGRIYKLECSRPDPDDWTFKTFFELGGDQPITAAVAILHLRGTPSKVLVFAGTGGDSRVQTPSGFFFKIAGIEDRDAVGVNGPGVIIKNVQGDKLLLDVPQDERVVIAPVTVGSADGQSKTAVFFASTKRAEDPLTCQPSFTSTLFAFEGTTGLGVFDLNPQAEGTQSQVTVEGKIQGLFYREEHLFVSKSGGLSFAADTEIRGKSKFTMPGEFKVKMAFLVTQFRTSPF